MTDTEPTAADVIVRVESLLDTVETVWSAGERRGVPHVWTSTVREVLREFDMKDGQS